jgi:hypothetical protein
MSADGTSEFCIVYFVTLACHRPFACLNGTLKSGCCFHRILCSRQTESFQAERRGGKMQEHPYTVGKPGASVRVGSSRYVELKGWRDWGSANWKAFPVAWYCKPGRCPCGRLFFAFSVREHFASLLNHLTPNGEYLILVRSFPPRLASRPTLRMK